MNGGHLHGQPRPPTHPWAGLDHQPIPGAVWMEPGCRLIIPCRLRSKRGWRDGGLATIWARQIRNSVPFSQRNRASFAARAALRSLPDTGAPRHGIMLPRFLPTKSHPRPTPVRTRNWEGCRSSPARPQLPASSTPAPNIPSGVLARLSGNKSREQQAATGHGEQAVI